ncbi:PAS domain-containing protein [Streptomyces sp. NPDC090994]|uniref:PAS domain-containing protein n=1 Tax=Streptomyces sp. NPDC090994 TaxID=3365969 RepID=UPI0038056AE5
MPSPLSADPPSAQPSEHGSVEALIAQARRLKGEVDAVRRGARGNGADPRGRWQLALYDLALHQLDDLDQHLAQLRDGPLPRTPTAGPAARAGSLLSRVGSAEWNLLTDGADWSPELYRILGRDPAAPPLTLDELPSVVLEQDRPELTAMVTGCLVDARPINGEFRVVRPDGTVRTVHMMGEPVLDAHGSTASMWAVLRDVSELRRSQRAVHETRDSLPAAEHRVPPRPGAPGGAPESAPPRLPGPPRLSRTAGLEPAVALPPETAGPAVWYDACEIAEGVTFLSAGSLTGPGPGGTADPALVAGTLRGMALAGLTPAALLDRLGRLPGTAARPALDGAVCCTYRAADRTLVWAHTGRPAPLLFRGGTGRVLGPGREETLEAGDLLLVHTGTAPADRLLALAPRLAGTGPAQDAVRLVARECGGADPAGRRDAGCVLAARVRA